MNTNYLLPNKYKSFGWILFTIGIISGLFSYFIPMEKEPIQTKVLSILNNFAAGPNEMEYFKIIEAGIGFELILLSIIIGGLLVGFTREKIEDEFTYKLRNDSLVWAIILNYLVLIVLVLFVHNFTFIYVMTLNMLTPLIFFILRFNFIQLRHRSHEE